MYQYAQPKTESDIKCSGDCMVRALTLATGATYAQAHKALYDNGWRAVRRNSQGKDDLQMIKAAETLGFKLIKRSFPAVKGQPRMNGHRMVAAHPNGSFIMRMARHMACLSYGVVKDTWDCREKCVYYAFEVIKNQ